MSTHPHWATKHKRKGTELRLINGRYYLYEVSSKWDPEKKRARKITGPLLGKITKEDGFIESEKAKLRKKEVTVSKLCVKEYGVTAFLVSHLAEYKKLLKKHFPEHWHVILALAYGRFVHHSPMKNMEHYFVNSFLSQELPKLSLLPKNISRLLRDIGTKRENITDFFKEFSKANDNIIFDGTDLISNSRKMDITKFSKTKKGTFDSTANIMFVFSVGLQLPIYYRILPGNIKDIKAFKLCLTEAQISDAVVIADKGFYSDQNIKELKKEEIDFIIPLKRNSRLISYDAIRKGDKKALDGFFKFEKRIIWYYKTKLGEENIIVFLDEEMKAEEIKDYLNRIQTHPEKYSLQAFHEKQHSFGTIAMTSNLDKTSEQIFTDYKSRGQVETMIDALKNIIDADKSYMQNEQALETWMFINYIALHWYYKIFQLLKQYELNHKFSPMDLIMFLKEVKKVRINKKWHLAEITKKTSDLLKKLNIHIT